MLAPKGCEWLVIDGARVAVVMNYRNGLTAFEAWRESAVPCAYHVVTVVQLTPYPSNELHATG